MKKKKKEKKEEVNNITKTSKYKKNIQILNTFEFEYKENEKKEKIIKKVKEIPYLIIIDKKAFNLNEINNMLIKEQLINKNECLSKNKEKINENFHNLKNNKIKKSIYTINNAKEIYKECHNIKLKKKPFVIERKYLDIQKHDND